MVSLVQCVAGETLQQEEGDKRGGSKVSLVSLYTPIYFADLCKQAMVQIVTELGCVKTHDISFVLFEG